MAANYTYITTNGLIVPNTSTLLATVQSEWQAAFGADLIVTPDTPQGVMITAETLARSNVLQNNAVLANQINPNYAGGVFLDAIMALTGMERVAATKTLVPGVTLSGVAGTIIPSGSKAKTDAGDIFESVTICTIGSGGTVTVDFQAVETGEVPCAIAALNTIVTGILGWDNINNTTAGTLGKDLQADSGARAFRKNTLAFQGISLAEAITSALYAIPEVKSLTFRENTTNSTATIDGISMVAHSVYACVDGGTDLEVASALLENKSSGSAWNGGTSVSIVEPSSGQTYTVLFDRPTVKDVLVRATVSGITSAEAKQAILDYAQGNINGLAGFVVGAAVSPFEIAGAIMAENPAGYVSSVEVSFASPISWVSTSLSIGINEKASTASGYITVTVA